MNHLKKCIKCNIEFEKKAQESLKFWNNRKYCSHSCANSVNKIGNKTRLGKSSWNKGLKLGKSKFNTSVEMKCQQCNNLYYVQKYRVLNSKFCSKSCHYENMNKGISSENEKVRKSKKYKDWRLSVFKRDNFTCVICNIKNKKGMGKTILLHADHIKSFAHYEDLRFDISNGRTLCIDCHKTTDNYGFRGRKNVIGVTTQI